MMYLTRYDPFLDVVKNLWGSTLPSVPPAENVNRFAPLADVVEKKDKWLFRFDIPGIDRNNIHIDVDANQLIVAGERQHAEEKEEDGYVYTERLHGKFERRFALPDNADKDNITAEIDDGVLTVTVSKRETIQPRHIEVAKKQNNLL